MDQCSKTGCQFMGTHRAKICVPAIGGPQRAERAMKMLVGLPLCREHAKSFDVAGFLDVVQGDGKPTLRASITETLTHLGKSLPDFKRAWVVAERAEAEPAVH